MDTLLALAPWLHDTALAQALRASIWLYPLVNTAHLLGLALLLGAIAVVDLRLNGAWKQVPAGALTGVLVPVAAAGLGLSVASGLLLFAAKPADYLQEPLFLAKLGLIAAALLNLVLLRRARGWPGRHRPWPADPLPFTWRLAGALSLLLWLAVLLLGRLIGYR